MTFRDLELICAVAGRTRSFFLAPHKLAPAKYDVVPPARTTFAVIGRPPLPLLPAACRGSEFFVPFAVAGRGGRLDGTAAAAAASASTAAAAPQVREAVAGLAAAESAAASPPGRYILVRRLGTVTPISLYCCTR
jgi:hypothetical protein